MESTTCLNRARDQATRSSLRRAARVESPLVPSHTSPFELPVFDLMHRPGEMRERTLEFEAPERLGEGVAYVQIVDADDGSRWGPVTLATSSQPCCQCYGASIWAGIDRMLIGARSGDVESLTEFDEGPLPADWIGALRERGIEVVADVLREDACAVLRDYGLSGGPSY